jgi:hypothetical protein
MQPRDKELIKDLQENLKYVTSSYNDFQEKLSDKNGKKE